MITVVDCYSKILYPALDDDRVSAVICVILCLMTYSGLLNITHRPDHHNTPFC